MDIKITIPAQEHTIRNVVANSESEAKAMVLEIVKEKQLRFQIEVLDKDVENLKKLLNIK